MADKRGVFEELGPKARVQAELTKLESQNRDVWVISIFAAAVLALGALSLLVPKSFWHTNELELKIAPQILFVIMIVVMILAVFMMRREMEVQRLRLLNLQQALDARSEQSASMIDATTNVFNRSFLRDLLQGEIARAERNNRPVGLVMCDLDHFKQVNDQYGHLMGDYVLAQIAGILKSCVRGSDYVVRYGGDEFLLVLPETTEPGAMIVLKRIQEKVEEWDRSNRIGDLPVSVSLGFYSHVPGQTAEQDVAEADARMYAEKKAPRRKTAEESATPTESR